MTHILHIANDYSGSKVYSLLVEALDKLGIMQDVFTTIRKEGQDGKNAIPFQCENSKIYYSKNWHPLHRVLFRKKTHSNYKHLLKHIDPKKITHVHAHTLFSDGILALKLKRDYGIHYTVSIRNTDINIFMKFMVHTWNIGREVLLNANKVICISPAHVERVQKWIACPSKKIATKILNIPNGVDQYWLSHLACKIHPHEQDSPWNIIYVGNFTANKNIPRLMKAVIQLNKCGIKVSLSIIGGGGNDEINIQKIAKIYPDFFKIHGIITDKDKLRSLYRQAHIFSMPSFHETFGLVYVEALSQGLPILYTKDEGVYGFFDREYGLPCNPNKKKNISNTIKELIKDYNSFSISAIFLRDNFDWAKIAQKYATLYSPNYE